MRFKEGDKLASDDYAAIGILRLINSEWVVVTDEGKAIPFEDYCADWEYYHEWLEKVKAERKRRGGFFKRLFS